ncbi:hypothetical protein BGZ93_009888 [Podila epicladia]|nr:hypothetical protein BGZ92_007661 [Podila epicladia]KAG0098915.1 hypothetical protein BGZ93_009888 [Podila epicladia]
MVRLSLSFLSVAALSLASAAPYFGQNFFESGDRGNKCIRETNIKENQLFELQSNALKSIVSRQLTDNMLVGGVPGSKNFQQLQFCVVTSDVECSTSFTSDCIRQDKDYRFRVNGPMQGYLHIEGSVIRIVRDYYEATALNLYGEAGWGLRIEQVHCGGTRSVFATTQPGAPIRMEHPQSNNVNQWFELMEVNDFDNFESFESKECVPETDIKEYQSFKLMSNDLESYVSKPVDRPILVGGVPGDNQFNELEFCVVGDEGECNPSHKTNCIYQNVQYRFRVFGPVKGYLRVEGDFVTIISNFHDASPMTLYKEADWGLRIEHKMPDGTRRVFVTREPGQPITLDTPQKKNGRQWFDLQRSERINEIEFSGPNQCVPETTIREYHPFLLKSTNLDTYVSKEREENILVGGVANNKNFQQLELCIVSSDYGCSSKIHSACIYQNVDYRFRVNGPTRGYLRIEGNEIKIVDDFEDASGLNLYKEAGWGLRVAHMKRDGTRMVFSAKKQGQPITMEEPVTNAARQWFQIVENRRNEHALW